LNLTYLVFQYISKSNILKKIAEKCCDAKEEYINYILGVGCGFGFGKNPQKNYDSTVRKIRIELLNTLLFDCESIFSHSIIQNGLFTKSYKRLPTIVSYSLKQFRDRSSCIDFWEQGNKIHVTVYKRRNPLKYIFGQKKVQESFEININNVELLFGKHFIGKFLIKTDIANYIFKDGKVYRSFHEN
jgi:hypothetical protein